MALTRYQVEKAIAGDGTAARGRCGLIMAQAQLSTVVNPGANPPNADLDDAMARALEYLRLYPVDRMAVTDADLAPLDSTTVGRFLDLVEIFVLEVCSAGLLTRATKQSWAHYDVEYALSPADLGTRIAALWDAYHARYERSGAPAIAPMTRETRHELEPTRYFRPYGFPGPNGPFGSVGSPGFF